MPLTDEEAAKAPLRILLVDDNLLDIELELDEFRRAAIAIDFRVAMNKADLHAALKDFEPEVILSDIAIGTSFNGAAVARITRELCPNVPLVFVSGTVTEEQAVVAMQSAAVDYVLKSRLVRLASATLRAVAEAAEKKRRLIAEARLEQAVEQLAGMAQSIDSVLSSYSVPERRMLYASPAVKIVYGRDPQEMLSNPNLWKDVIVAEDRPLVREARKRLFKAGGFDVDYRIALPDGGIRWVNHRARLARVAGLPLRVDSVVADITERMGRQQRIARLSRIRDVLSAVNTAIVRISDRAELFRESCRIAYEAGGFVNVFAFSIDAMTQHPEIMAIAGKWAQGRDELQRRIEGTVAMEHGDTIISAALQTQEHAVTTDLTLAPINPIYEQVIKQGVKSNGAFPLVTEGRLLGAMVFDTEEANYFDGDEIELLKALTSNLAFALGNLSRQERVTRLSRIRDMLAAVNAAIVRLHDSTELFREVCRIAFEAGGFMNVFVAMLDVETRDLTIPAFIGKSDGVEMERSLRERLADTKHHTRVEAAIRTLRPVVENDLRRSGRRGSLGVRATAAFPLIVDGRGIGVLVVETDVGGYFDAEELTLLTGLTNDLSFALNLIDKQKRVDYLSYYDALTQLPNRTLFYDRLGSDLAAAKRAGKMAAIILIDISRFSVLNNSLGEQVGDGVLHKIADRLRSIAEESRLARVAGDRFVISFPVLDDLRDVTELVTEDGVRIFDAPFVIGDREIHITARAGCAVFPNDGEDAEELFRNAEAALQSAKSSGFIYRFYSPDFNARLMKELDLESRLQRAIEESQFVLYYQRKVDITSGEIVGFEALIRWQDPERGLILPGEFIPLLEQTGAIVTVGRWTMIEAVRQYEEWRRAGLRPPRIAVNLSAVQLRQDRLIEDVRNAISGFEGIPALDLEVTESMLMENFDTAIATLSAIRSLGVELALDDFGTGYSSLSYLHRLPLNALKIDRSFVVGMTVDANKTSIVSTILSLAGALKLKVIAEGVETKEQARLLRLLRCDIIQGYLYGEPEPADVTAQTLAKRFPAASAGSGLLMR